MAFYLSGVEDSDQFLKTFLGLSSVATRSIWRGSGMLNRHLGLPTDSLGVIRGIIISEREQSPNGLLEDQ